MITAVILCSDNKYYTGVTNDPERRIIEHNSGINKKSYTSFRLPVEMIYCERFTDFNLAIEWEKTSKELE